MKKNDSTFFVMKVLSIELHVSTIFHVANAYLEMVLFEKCCIVSYFIPK